jgi:xanthine dehydrogenase small subunit
MDKSLPLKNIHFIRAGRVVSLANVPPSRTLLEVLREDLCSTGTKEGCGEGDCGACTVVLGERQGDTLNYRAVNSCIRLAHSVNGMAVWTAEDLSAADGSLHPVQSAMVECHASQCGFCTPGFVMSLFAMYQNHTCKGRAISRELAQQELSGNLCRCTGYRPILEAAQRLDTLPAVTLDEANLLAELKLIAPESMDLEADLIGSSGYASPLSLTSLLNTRATYPKAQIVAGTTDVGLWVTKQHRQFEQIIDITKVAELRRIEDYPQHIAIGAAVTLNNAFHALTKDRPQLHHFAARFAGLSVRNSGTLGGNVANGSPIGDSMPLLIALGAHVVLMSIRGSREMPLEQLYTGYRQNVMAGDEVLAWIKVPKPTQAEFLRIYKISKRFDDDISAICLGLSLELDNGIVSKMSLGVGGVAATPIRAVKTEAVCTGKHWSKATIEHAKTVLRAEFSPLSDMRASSAYRTQVLGNLLERFWLESQGLQQINLESLALPSHIAEHP